MASRVQVRNGRARADHKARRIAGVGSLGVPAAVEPCEQTPDGQCPLAPGVLVDHDGDAPTGRKRAQGSANAALAARNVSAFGDRCEVLNAAVWSEDGEVSYEGGEEQGYHVMSEGGGPSDRKVAARTIDSIFHQFGLDAVDYLKMDIEGAELKALQGAEGTIRAFRPRLAISIYHREDDFIEIPRYLNGLGLGYEFYLDHFTIYGEETVLFARPGKLTN